ncbi:MAG TPA: septum formation initiator family protein [Candidatus Moranbacteria bacterium]|nr:septum formation initiator family protein [Candidatus Moranbacteria bacterium]
MTKEKKSFIIVFFIVGVIFTVIIIGRVAHQAFRNQKIEKEVEALKKKAESIKSENEKIQKQIEYYSRPEFVEKISKDKINMQKPDEKVVVVNEGVLQKPETVGEDTEKYQNEEQIPNYKKWWNSFFKYN